MTVVLHLPIYLWLLSLFKEQKFLAAELNHFLNFKNQVQVYHVEAQLSFTYCHLLPFLTFSSVLQKVFFFPQIDTFFVILSEQLSKQPQHLCAIQTSVVFKTHFELGFSNFELQTSHLLFPLTKGMKWVLPFQFLIAHALLLNVFSNLLFVNASLNSRNKQR